MVMDLLVEFFFFTLFFYRVARLGRADQDARFGTVPVQQIPLHLQTGRYSGILLVIRRVLGTGFMLY